MESGSEGGDTPPPVGVATTVTADVEDADAVFETTQETGSKSDLIPGEKLTFEITA